MIAQPKITLFGKPIDSYFSYVVQMKLYSEFLLDSLEVAFLEPIIIHPTSFIFISTA